MHKLMFSLSWLINLRPRKMPLSFQDEIQISSLWFVMALVNKQRVRVRPSQTQSLRCLIDCLLRTVKCQCCQVLTSIHGHIRQKLRPFSKISRPPIKKFVSPPPISHRKLFFYTAWFELFGGGHGHLATLLNAALISCIFVCMHYGKNWRAFNQLSTLFIAWKSSPKCSCQKFFPANFISMKGSN